MMTPQYKTVQCPGCLCFFREYGDTPIDRDVRLDAAGILWCEHHKRMAKNQLKKQVGQVMAIQMIAGLELFALRHSMPRQPRQPGAQGGPQ